MNHNTKLGIVLCVPADKDSILDTLNKAKLVINSLIKELESTNQLKPHVITDSHEYMLIDPDTKNITEFIDDYTGIYDKKKDLTIKSYIKQSNIANS
jgi:hypothetical protein